MNKQEEEPANKLRHSLRLSSPERINSIDTETQGGNRMWCCAVGWTCMKLVGAHAELVTTAVAGIADKWGLEDLERHTLRQESGP